MIGWGIGCTLYSLSFLREMSQGMLFLSTLQNLVDCHKSSIPFLQGGALKLWNVGCNIYFSLFLLNKKTLHGVPPLHPAELGWLLRAAHPFSLGQYTEIPCGWVHALFTLTPEVSAWCPWLIHSLEPCSYREPSPLFFVLSYPEAF